jgi:hypothetical protein
MALLVSSLAAHGLSDAIPPLRDLEDGLWF